MPHKDPIEERAYERKRKDRNPEYQRALGTAYYERNKESILARQRVGREKNRPRETANNRLRRAIRNGWIDKPEGIVFHHPDYSRPYYGCWVDQKTHMRIHAGLIECPDCIDYTARVEGPRCLRKK